MVKIEFPEGCPPSAILAWDGTYIQSSNAHLLGIDDDAVVGQSVLQFVPLKDWLAITAMLKRGEMVTDYFLKIVTPLGAIEESTNWMLKKKNNADGRVIYAEATKIELVESCAKSLNSVISLTSLKKTGLDNKHTISSSQMNLHRSLQSAVEKAFNRFPLLTHREILEESKVIIDEEKIRIYCPSEEEAIALSEGRWDLASYAYQPYLPNSFEVYYRGEDQAFTLHSAFSSEDAKQEEILQLREIRDMMRQIGDNGLLVPSGADFRALCTTVLHNPGLVTLVSESDSKPIVVSPAYAEWTNRPMVDWIGDSEGNKARWGHGEMERMQAALERDGFLSSFGYTAYFFGNPDEQTWHTTFQRIQIDGRWYRIGKVLNVTQKNLVMV